MFDYRNFVCYCNLIVSKYLPELLWWKGLIVLSVATSCRHIRRSKRVRNPYPLSKHWYKKQRQSTAHHQQSNNVPWQLLPTTSFQLRIKTNHQMKYQEQVQQQLLKRIFICWRRRNQKHRTMRTTGWTNNQTKTSLWEQNAGSVIPAQDKS